MSTLDRARDAAARERPLRPAGLAIAALVLVAAAGVSAAMPQGAAARWFLAGTVALVLAFVALRSTTQSVLATFVWLFALGMSRRLASEVLADPGRDPFLVVSLAPLVVLGARAVLVGALRRLTVLAWLLLAFTALAFVQLANPHQPSGAIRLAGLLVWVVPTAWFWVGRTLVRARLARSLLLVVVGLTTVIALYGIAQSVSGFPPWDQRWIRFRGYAALYIGPGTVRPFGSMASAAEFALACAVGVAVGSVLWFGPRLLVPDRANRRARHRDAGRRRWLVVLGLAACAITGGGLLLSAIRTYLVLVVVALPVMYLVYRGKRAWKVLVPAILLVALGFALLAQVDPDSIGRNGAQAGIRRIIVFVHDPFAKNRENTDNTLQLHYENAKFGVEQAFEKPLGRGTGSTGVPGEHFGAKAASTDFDMADAGIAFGIAGLLLSLAIVVSGFVTAIRAVRRKRTFEGVALVGILVVSFGAWFQGAHYALAPLLWLLLGRADGVLVHGPDGSESAPDTEAPGAADQPGAVPAPTAGTAGAAGAAGTAR